MYGSCFWVDLENVTWNSPRIEWYFLFSLENPSFWSSFWWEKLTWHWIVPWTDMARTFQPFFIRIEQDSKFSLTFQVFLQKSPQDSQRDAGPKIASFEVLDFVDYTQQYRRFCIKCQKQDGRLWNDHHHWPRPYFLQWLLTERIGSIYKVLVKVWRRRHAQQYWLHSQTLRSREPAPALRLPAVMIICLLHSDLLLIPDKRGILEPQSVLSRRTGRGEERMRI